LRSVSVEFKDGNATVVGGAFVNIPANPEARVLASKAAFQDGLNAISAGTSASDVVAMTQAIHDASVHIGAMCAVPVDVDPDEDDSGADDAANKDAALRLRLKALRR
jgi:hypothetical protein